MPKPPDPDPPPRHHHGLRVRLRALYHGSSPGAVRFRVTLLIVDAAIIAFFIAAPLMHERGIGF